MSELAAATAVPARLWRRLVASSYDGLLLIALWFASTLIDVVVSDLLGGLRSGPLLRAVLFVIGLGFFGWFWVHGGQTLGMRAWKLRVQREDGRALSWPTAAVRYMAMLACWTVVLLPALTRLPHIRDFPYSPLVALGAMTLTALGLIAMLIDQRRRAPHDWCSGCVVVETLPRA